MIRFRLLGPLTVEADGEVVTLTAPMQRRVLALLLLQSDSVVLVGRLVEELWGDRPPLSARTTLQTYVYQLRKLLGAREPIPCPRGAERGGALLTRLGGYQFRLGEGDELDVHDFERLLAKARTLHGEGLLEDAAAVLRSALDLWSGPPLADIDRGPLLDAEATRLEESRKAALELRLEIDLQTGHHLEVISELTSLVGGEPTHEGFAAKLMLALVRAGRRTDALEVYQRSRAALVAELGLEPSGDMRRLHQLILSDDGDLSGQLSRVGAPAPATVLAVPAQLPPDVRDFVGREAELARVRAMLAGPDGGDGLRMVEVCGAPGIGNSAFALHLAHQLRGSYPDGQFYAQVGDTESGGESTTEILGRFLRGCGVPPERLPTRELELGSMFRTWTADRRVLVVLDDIPSASLVRVLQPSGSACAMVWTSRSRLPGLPAAGMVELPPLSTAEGLRLLGDEIGRHRVDTERADAERLVELCDHLPLAIRAAARKLAGRPQWPLSRFVDRLRDPSARLAALGWGGDRLLTSLRHTCERLSAPAATAVRLLGSRGLRTVTADGLAAQLGGTPAAAEAVLDQLVDARLVREQVHGGEFRYRVPTLVSLAAAQLAADHRGAAGPRAALPVRALAHAAD
ncbi:AfsR/SARP family transcriptional regulator [Saccharothrix australiensis]|uniref:DNA-binding SARP family transcriptional activator n=1 Tax=Saccharothrix australiensis TaxID=2072 RepID=A0A495W1X3_9PSEU|nr:AfsR/SARP family transcriptional regulator [Saccharothrix australiensis]RKT55626.1 DNA-binding SARP family transcriptional activator [Saccharothrix australiensis]